MSGRIARAAGVFGKLLQSGGRNLNMTLGADEELYSMTQSPWQQSAVQRYPLGTRLQCGERVWRYAHILAAGAAGQRGRLMVCTDAGVQRGAFLGAIVNGVFTVNWTAVAPGIAANQFKDGYILMQGGFVHKIKSNTAALTGAISVLTLYEAFAPIEVLPAGRYGLMLESPYANVNALGPAPGSDSGRGMGILPNDWTPGNFVWIQTWGPCGVILFATAGATRQTTQITVDIAISDQMSPHTGVVGNDGLQTVGQTFIGGGTADWDTENFANVWLTIDP